MGGNMRDPNRIKPLLDALRIYWEMHPDLRLCQMLSNIATIGGWSDKDLYYLEDKDLMEHLKTTVRKEFEDEG
jgi:uncharacterized protein YihD (DUF1040 family)